MRAEIEAVEKHFRQQGCRWTSQRKTIVQTAFSTHLHFTVDELLDMVRKKEKQVSRATIYRTISLLEQGGFVEGLEVGDGPRRFEHVLGHEHHDHMVCLGCGKIIEFRDEQIERRQDLAAARHGFVIEKHSLRLYGKCSGCRASGREGRGGGGGGERAALG
jgi:Fur family ferric uptake transcriptional regulator